MPSEGTTTSVLLTPPRGQYAVSCGRLRGLLPQAVINRWLSTDPDADWSEATALNSGSRGSAINATILADLLGTPTAGHAVVLGCAAPVADTGAGMLAELVALARPTRRPSLAQLRRVTALLHDDS